MKLSLLTHNIARRWSLDRIITVARSCGFAGLELRIEEGHSHGVELGTTRSERRAIRERIEDAYLEVACLGTSARLAEQIDPRELHAVIERTRRSMELASDLGCGRVRVFGDSLAAGVDRSDCVCQLAESLHALGEFGQPIGVDVLLEMHGAFNHCGLATRAVTLADHPRVGILYNCDTRDLVAGSIEPTYRRVRPWLRHVHLHELPSRYPYPELLGLLRSDDYQGFLSPELATESPTAEHFLGIYTTLVRAWSGQPYWSGPAEV